MMRTAGLAVLSMLTLATADAIAADVPATSQIVGVVVFPSGAEITRTTKVRLPAGEHTVLLTDLPAQAVAGSIRVEGKAAGRLEIGAVDTRKLRVPRADPVQQATERRAVELEIERLRDERAVVEAEAKAAATQLVLVDRLSHLPEYPAPLGQPGASAQPDWGQLFGLIGQRSTEAQKSALAAQVKMRDLDRRIEDLQKKLASLSPAQDERTEVKVSVAAGAALEAELAVRYQVGGASWLPYYDARLTTGGRDAVPKLGLVRRASIQQRTGEDWKDVALQLSTTRPGSGTAAPELSTLIVDFEPDAPLPRPVASMPAPAPMARSMRLEKQASEDAVASGAVSQPPPQAPAEERRAQIDAAAFQAVYTVPGKLTVLGTGEQKRVQIDSTDLEPQLVVRSVPRIDAKAYLYAKLTLPKGTPYLPGQVALFRDGTFVGNGRLPLLAAGEEHELGFGADDAVRIRHAIVEEKRGEQGLISSSKTDQRSYRITVRNLHERAIGVIVLDRIPVSQNQDIKVEFTAKQPPTKRDLEDKRGTLAWEMKVEPQQEAQIEFGYRVQWPGSKRIQYMP